MIVQKYFTSVLYIFETLDKKKKKIQTAFVYYLVDHFLFMRGKGDSKL